MLHDVAPTFMKRAASYFKRVRVASGNLREFQPKLMVDNVEDLIDWEVQEGEGDGASVPSPSSGNSSLGARARCPLARFLELSC